MVIIVVLLAAAVSPFCENSVTEENMDIKNMAKIGGRLKGLREDKKLSQEQLAKELYLGSRSMVSQFENETRALTIDALLEYSRYFNVTTDWILKGVLAPSFISPKDIEDATGYTELKELYSSLEDCLLRDVALEQMRALCRLKGHNI